MVDINGMLSNVTDYKKALLKQPQGAALAVLKGFGMYCQLRLLAQAMQVIT